MKAKLKFDLENTDDDFELKRMLKASDMACFIFELAHNSKKGLEWSLESENFDKYETLDFIFAHIHDLLNKYKINIEEITY